MSGFAASTAAESSISKASCGIAKQRTYKLDIQQKLTLHLNAWWPLQLIEILQNVLLDGKHIFRVIFVIRLRRINVEAVVGREVLKVIVVWKF